MRVRARAASLCVAALLVVVLLPAAAQAQSSAPQPTMDGVWWPGDLAHPGDAIATPEALGPQVISPGACPAAGETRTYTFSYSDQGVVLGADGRFSEHGSFTLRGTADGADLRAMESTFSASSPNGAIEGRREMRRGDVWGSFPGGVDCQYTSDADRLIGFNIQRAYVEYRQTSSVTGAVTDERGYGFVGSTSWVLPGGSTGWFAASFHADRDVDLIDDAIDDCPDVYNPGGNDIDDDGVGDDCDPDIDGDGFGNFPADNCSYVANPGQEDADHDGVGDVCDPAFDPQDSDRDGVIDRADNCPDVPNPEQADSGGDVPRGCL
jgi:thrombospondin type 3 repeat protein